jgi:MFS family permease
METAATTMTSAVLNSRVVSSAALTVPTEAVSRAEHVPHRWRNLLTLTGVTVVDNTEAGLTSTLFPTIARDLALNNANLGVLAALGKIAGVPAGPFWVWLASRIGRRRALVATTLTGGMFGIAAGFSHDFLQLLIFNSLLAACIIGGSPIANAVLADSFADRDRGKAAGYFYGVVSLMASVIGPLIALFTGLSDGWRYGMWTIGAICILAGLLVGMLFKDPGVGASEKQLADLSETARIKSRVSVQSVISLFRIRTFSVMMLSRLLSGHLLINIFGIQFLVTERGFSNAVAASVLLPFGLGYFAATIAGGWLLVALDRVMPQRGRVLYIQAAQVLFAVFAFVATQLYRGDNIAVYGLFWAVLGAGQGLNPPVNRPIVAAVVLPELRGQAFAIWLTIFETIGWALFSLGAGQLASALGIQAVFLGVLVVLMLVNAAVLGALYLTYPRDVERVETALERRRLEALAYPERGDLGPARVAAQTV